MYGSCDVRKPETPVEKGCQKTEVSTARWNIRPSPDRGAGRRVFEAKVYQSITGGRCRNGSRSESEALVLVDDAIVGRARARIIRVRRAGIAELVGHMQQCGCAVPSLPLA